MALLDPARPPTSGPLVGPTVLLRPLDPPRDARALFPPTHGDAAREATWQFMAYGPFDGEADMRRWIERCAASSDPSFRAVIDRESGTALGMVAFQRIAPDCRVLEVAHIWYVPSARRTRVNSEACFLMLRHAFDDLGYRRVEWKCDDRNEPSKAAALRLGFTREGTFRKHMIVKGRSRDTAWYAMLDDDWPRVRSSLERWLADPGVAGSLASLSRRAGRDEDPPGGPRPVDFGRHSEDYAAWRPGFPASFYGRLQAFAPIAGSRALDLATGPGTMALALGALGSSVVGIDIAEGQIATARRLAVERGLDATVRFDVARAEATGMAAGSFDLVTAGQCWHWFDAAAVLAEVQRVLQPGGVLAIAHDCYLAEHSPVARETEALILEFNPSWTMAGSTGVFPGQIDQVIRGGLDLIEAFCYDRRVEFSHARWRGRMRTCNGVGSGGLPPAEVERFDVALARLLDERYADPVVVEHRVWCVVAGKPGPVRP